MKAKKARRLRDILAFVGILIMFCGYIYEPLLFVGGIVALSCMIPHFLYYRCSHCGKHLGRCEGDRCWHCGKEIE